MTKKEIYMKNSQIIIKQYNYCYWTKSSNAEANYPVYCYLFVDLCVDDI